MELVARSIRNSTGLMAMDQNLISLIHLMMEIVTPIFLNSNLQQDVWFCSRSSSVERFDS